MTVRELIDRLTAVADRHGDALPVAATDGDATYPLAPGAVRVEEDGPPVLLIDLTAADLAD